ncbi:MAG: hypothetical protein PVG39_26905 [Desulfobacteraceae bacterium]|jgi:hypothetical protein
MDDNNTNSKEKSISENIEAQFDDLFAPKKPDEVPDSGKKSSVPETPPVKKDSKKVLPPKPLNKKVILPKASVPGKQLSTTGKPSAKADQRKIIPDKTVVQKMTPSVTAGKRKPPVKQDTPVTKKDEFSRRY